MKRNLSFNLFTKNKKLKRMIHLTINKMDIFTNEYRSCLEHAKNWESNEGSYYTGILCCKPVNSVGKNNEKSINKAYESIKNFITNTKEEITNLIEDDLCVLAKNHTGKCSNTVNIFSKLPKSTIGKIKTAIYQTPGNDDYIFKNRSNRLFPIKLTEKDQRSIKNKEKKLSCAIPLKDGSTPLMQAGAYLDYITFVYNIKEISELVDSNAYTDVLNEHKKELIRRFKNKKIFNKEGFTVCPVTGHEITLDDISGDTRIENGTNDIQIGHCEGRNENSFTIRGFNILLMTREGNRLVGDYSFFDDAWLEKMKRVLTFQTE
jgi:hypothetical protein